MWISGCHMRAHRALHSWICTCSWSRSPDSVIRRVCCDENLHPNIRAVELGCHGRMSSRCSHVCIQQHWRVFLQCCSVWIRLCGCKRYSHQLRTHRSSDHSLSSPIWHSMQRQQRSCCDCSCHQAKRTDCPDDHSQWLCRVNLHGNLFWSK